ncbi:MAG: ABC transporter ATP-binding protein [Caldilineaceae bacterium]
MNVYELHNVSKQYSPYLPFANHEIFFQIGEGEIFGLLGDNGAGKSTLIRQMVNLVKSTAGEITFFGKPLHQQALELPLSVGYMPQRQAAVNQLTAHEALYFTAHLRGLSRNDAQKERDRLIGLWQIGPVAHKPAARLSGGEGRLLQLALAMAGSPPVMILDEPTNELSPQRRKQVWENLRQINQQQGTTIIFITHDAIEAEKIIQRVGILHHGKLLAIGKPSDLKRQIDHQLRLELHFSPDTPPKLAPTLPITQLDTGRWLVYLGHNQVEQTLASLDMAKIDDFKLYSATLEDLYLQVAGVGKK